MENCSCIKYGIERFVLYRIYRVNPIIAFERNVYAHSNRTY